MDLNPICTCMRSTSLSLFAPDRKYGFRNYSLGKRKERSRERRSAGGRSATSPRGELESEARRCSPQWVVGGGGGLARERSAPAPAVIGRPLSAALSLGGTQPSSPLRAPNPAAGRPAPFLPGLSSRRWRSFGVPRSSAQTPSTSRRSRARRARVGAARRGARAACGTL